MPFFSPKGEPLQNPYELLNLEHGATDDDIAKSFKKLMLQLHPDKQPAGQSAEEAEQVSQKLHDVMDAKSFLLDGDHLTARRAYDSKLVRAKHQATFPPPKQAAASAGNKPTTSSSGVETTKQSSSNAVKQPKGGNKQSKASATSKSDDNPKTASSQSKKKVHVTQWGKAKPNRNSRTRPMATRRSSLGDQKDPTKNKTHTRTTNKSKAFNDSCGDCSTTDDCSTASDDELKRNHSYSNATTANKVNNHRPSSNRPPPSNSNSKARQKLKSEPTAKNTINSNNNKRRSNLDTVTEDTNTNTNNNKRKNDANTNKRSSEVKKSEQRKSGYRPADAAKSADFSTFYPALNVLEKQYHCPLTKEIMKEPMSDFEGNSYEREAILRYLEARSTSPVTGNPLYAMHLTPNSALKEKIRYTVKLKVCLDSLQNAKIAPLPAGDPRYKSLTEAVDCFIKDLNSKSPAITITPLDNSGTTSFSYLGLKFRLEVPEGINDNIIVQTRFEHSKKAAGVSGRVVQFNAAFQKLGLGGKLTFRKMEGKYYAFTLAKTMSTEKFSKMLLRHCIEYFVEMAIKLHNAIESTDLKQVGKVRLTNSAAG